MSISYLHIRYPNVSRGGYTIAWNIDDNELYIGIARCHKEDMYNKKVGRAVSSEKLLSKDSRVQLPKSHLIEILTSMNFFKNEEYIKTINLNDIKSSFIEYMIKKILALH